MNNKQFSENSIQSILPGRDGGFCIHEVSQSKPSLPKLSKKTKPAAGLIVPDKPRDFNQAEQNILKNVPYRRKLSGDNDKAFQRLLVVITIMEANGARTIDGCMMAKHTLGQMVKGTRTAQDILQGLIKSGVLFCNSKHYDMTKNIARRYSLSDGFKMAISKTDKQPEPIQEQPKPVQEPIQEQPEPIQESMKTEDYITEQKEEELILDTIRRNNTTFTKAKYSKLEIDPEQERECSCCGNQWPNFLFPINKAGGLYSKCKVCFDLENVSGDAMPTAAAFIAEVKDMNQWLGKFNKRRY